MIVTTGVVPMRRMDREGSISWTVVVCGRSPVGRVRAEAFMMVQLDWCGGDVSKIRSGAMTKIGGGSVTGVGLEQGKAGMVDPTESSSMVSRGWVNKLSGKAVECFENTMVGGVVVYLVVAKRARKISTREYVEISEGARL